MNKIYTLILTVFLITVLMSCEDDKCDLWNIDEDLMGIPVVMKGSFPLGELNPVIGDSIVFAPQLLDTTGITYSWNLSGQIVSTDSVFIYKIDQPCRAKVTCTLQNRKGKVEMSTDIISRHDLSKGVMLISQTVDFYDLEADRFYTDVYASLNYGKGPKAGDYDTWASAAVNDKLYFLLKNSTTNTEHLFVTGVSTLYQEHAFSVGANLDNFVPLNDRYALISGDKLLRMDLTTFKTTPLFKTNSWSLYNTIILNNKLLVNATYSFDENEDETPAAVDCVDINDLLQAAEGTKPVMTSLDIQQDGKYNFVKAQDGNIYTIGYTKTSGKHYLATIAPDFSVVKVELPFVPLKPQYRSDPTIGMAASIQENAIFIASEDQKIYKYIPGEVSSLSQPWVNAVPDGFEISTSLQIDIKTGNLWVAYVSEVDWYEYIGKIIIYDTSGKAIKTIDCGEAKIQTMLLNH